MERPPFRFGPTGIFETMQLWRWSIVTGLVISVGRTEMSQYPFAKIIVSSTALFYPAYKNK